MKLLPKLLAATSIFAATAAIAGPCSLEINCIKYSG